MPCKKKYLFVSIGDKTCYFLAYDMTDTKEQYDVDDFLIRTKESIGKSPKHFTTDRLPASLNHLNKYLIKIRINDILHFLNL